MTSKKRTSLDALGLGVAGSSTGTNEKKVEGSQNAPTASESKKLATTSKKASEKLEIAKTTVYVPRAVFEQWRELAFTERKKMHDYLIEGLDRIFKDRGLKSIAELTDKEHFLK